MKKILKITLLIVGSLIGLIALFLLSVWLFSGNTPEGGTKIAKKGWAQIGGIKQGFFIRGENERNPVILFLHGGPGSPELPMIKDTELEKHPELYHAYIGIGQVCNQLESERLAYDYIVGEARKAGDSKTVEAFEAYDKSAPDFPSNEYLLKARSPSMNKYGVGIKHKDCSMFDLVVDVLYYRGYTFMDKMHYSQGAMFSLDHVFHKVIEDNLFETSTRFEIPVYIIQGKYDYQVSYQLAKAYSDSINAPQKEFFTFEESAHSPNMEESKRFVEVVCSIAEKVK